LSAGRFLPCLLGQENGQALCQPPLPNFSSSRILEKSAARIVSGFESSMMPTRPDRVIDEQGDLLEGLD
jgi:hypothetical protein